MSRGGSGYNCGMGKRASARSVTAAQGFYAAGATCGIKRSGSPDLALIASDRPCAAAGVFTTSRTPAAPIAVNRLHLESGRAQAVVVNSGIANASTGKAGEDDAHRMCGLTAQYLGQSGELMPGVGALDAGDVLVASTGIIGRMLPMEKIDRGIATLSGRLSRGRSADADAARAIMTTDLAPKAAHRTLTLGGKAVQIGGIAKGSGMIAPNMATMLAFVTTDAAIAPEVLQQAIRDAAAASFNRISVDQHTSPSDMAIVLANGAAGNRTIDGPGRNLDHFRAVLTDLCRDLAEQIVRDGEGATKLLRVRVDGAATEEEADRVAKAVVDSPLVKTAVHGGDPNWGRIVTAAGYSGAAIDPAAMSLTIGATPRDGGRIAAVCVYRHGVPSELSAADQRRLVSAMKKTDITFTIDLGGAGKGAAGVEWLGCDLSRQYIAINADYTT